MNLTAFKNAVAALVRAELGAGTGKVLWANQGRSRPARPFVELAITDGLGGNPEGAEEQLSVNPSPTADTPATVNLATLLPGGHVTGLITTTAVGLLANYAIRVITSGGALSASFDPTFNAGQGRLTIDLGASGTVTPAQINTAVNAIAGTPFVSTLAGSGPVTTTATGAFTGGTNGTDTFLIDYVTHDTITVQVTVFTTDVNGDGEAAALLHGFSRRLNTSRVNDTLNAQGLAIVQRGTIQDISLELQNEFEGRAVMALIIRMADKYTETADRFDKVTVETEVDRDNGNPPVTDSVTYDT